MSSDDSGFDKEAEREKLREKYDRDEQDRENTRRMSELLLQGATMTGKHCNECGDPIFRYDGQEFCPTCQHEVETGQKQASAESTGTEANRRPTDADDAERGVEVGDDTETDQSASEGDASGEPRVELNDIRVADRHADSSDLRQPPSQQAGRTGDDGLREHARERVGTPDHDAHARERDARTHEPIRTPEAGDHPDDLAPAREALVRKLTDLARRAEETDDVARARELLAATREAAEALNALDRANH